MPGGPSKISKPVGVLLRNEQIDALEEIASQATKVNRSLLVRTAISEWLNSGGPERFLKQAEQAKTPASED